MIRRHLGAKFRLFNQHDHAALSGKLAAALREPLPDEAVRGIALHDAGWPLSDDVPPLSGERFPQDIFESDIPDGLRIWLASAERAAEVHPYAGLLTSLHSQALAGNNLSADMSRRTQFDWLTFTTRIAELQVQWRTALGMRTDRPTQGGLAVGWADERELALRQHFRWLQALDKLSLDACCTKPPFATIDVGPDLVLRVERPGDADLRVGPWVFADEALEFDVPYRAVDARPFADAEQLHAVLADTPVQAMRFSLRPLR